MEPEAGSQVVMTEPSTASLAEAAEGDGGTVGGGGLLGDAGGYVHCRAGGVLDVTVKELSPMLPAASLAEQVTVVVPSGKTVPDALLQVTSRGPSTSSSAVTAA